MDTLKLIEYKKTNKPPADVIDQLINKIIFTDNHSSQNITEDKIKTEKRKWIMPEEPQGFIKCKKYDPL